VLTVIAVASVIVTQDVSVQPWLSVTVTQYVPAVIFVKSSEVGPVVHRKLYGDVPPPGVRSAAPSLPPAQLTLVPIIEDVKTVGSDKVMLSAALQLRLSVTVTVYIMLAQSAVPVAADPPVGDQV
jgi:hypothetical protein